METVATIVDKDRKCFKFKCPACNLVHVSRANTGAPWDQVSKVLIRTCPKSKQEIHVAVKKPDNTHNGIVADILKVPMEGCTECYMTGEIVGFTSVRICGCCRS